MRQQPESVNHGRGSLGPGTQAPSTGGRLRAPRTTGEDVLGDSFPVARFTCESRERRCVPPRKTWNQYKVWCISLSGEISTRDTGLSPVVSLS